MGVLQKVVVEWLWHSTVKTAITPLLCSHTEVVLTVNGYWDKFDLGSRKQLYSLLLHVTLVHK